jgi:hypothetical protein
MASRPVLLFSSAIAASARLFVRVAIYTFAFFSNKTWIVMVSSQTGVDGRTIRTLTVSLPVPVLPPMVNVNITDRN